MVSLSICENNTNPVMNHLMSTILRHSWGSLNVIPTEKIQGGEKNPQVCFPPSVAQLSDSLAETRLSFISVWHTNTTLADACSVNHSQSCLSLRGCTQMKEFITLALIQGAVSDGDTANVSCSRPGRFTLTLSRNTWCSKGWWVWA